MNLDEAQRGKVAEWVGQGLKLSEIQGRLANELGVRLTYMEVRLLVDDLKLTPKDPEPANPVSGVLQGQAESAPPGPAPAPARSEQGGAAAPATRGVSVSVDQLARAGALVSGKVTFSDGVSAEWYLDQTGRLGVSSQQPGYRPSAQDVQQFQAALDTELSKMGF